MAMVGLVAASWGWVGLGDPATGGIRRFLRELVPWPLQPKGEGALGAWLVDLGARGGEAALATVALSVVAMALAVALTALVVPLATSTLARDQPFVALGPRSRLKAWLSLRLIARGGLLLARAVPEYILAFLLLTVLGFGAWPAVLALALHNAGILGRLSAEALEDVEPAAPRALRMAGASRLQVLALGLFPAVRGRLVLYTFVRWESCIREATVLGMLGFVGLGWLFQDARARGHYDELAFFIGIGALLIVAGDVASSRARAALREG